MKRLLLLIVILVMICGANAAIPELTDYSKVTTLNINITAAMGAQTDYQVKFILSNRSGVSGYYAPDNVIFTNGTTRPDWYDINVTDSADTPLKFWVETNTATAYNATMWISNPSIAIDNSSAIKVRYGYSAQTETTVDIMGIFPSLADDMLSATYNTSKWTTVTASGGSVTQGGGELVVTSSGTSNYGVNTSVYLPVNNSIRMRAKHNTTDAAAYISYWGWRPAATVSGAAQAVFMQQNTNFIGYSYDGSAGSTQTLVSSDANYHVVDIKRNSTNSITYCIDSTCYDKFTNIPTTQIPQAIISYGSGTKSVVDWFLVRKSVWIEPTTSNYVTTEQTVTPIAAFSCIPTSAQLGTPIVCTDESSDTPTNWSWSFGDGNTSIEQNPTYTYPFTGTFTINMSANNTVGIDWENKTNYITITNVSSFTQQDIYLTGQYLITFNVKSSTTNLPIANVTVVDSVSGQSYPSTNGTAFLTLPAGLYYINFIADGYQSKQVTYVVDQDETHEVKMVPGTPVTPSPPSIVYIPQQVRIQLIGTDGYYLSGVFIQATPINFTAPENWTETLLGINPSVGIRGTTVYGTTGTDGSWVAPMLQSFQYQINLTRVSDVNYNFTLYPQSTEYRFTIPVAGFVPVSTPSNVVSYSLQNATINETTSEMYQFINMTYNDGSLNTDKLSFVVYDVNSTLVYSQNYTGSAANAQNFSYVQRCGKGQAYTYGFQANQSAYGWINQSSTFQLTSQIELLQNGPSWIGQWIAIVLIVVFGTLFMIYSKPFALIGIPLLTWSFQYVFKLIPGSFLSLIGLGCMLTIGVLVYIRQAENKIQ